MSWSVCTFKNIKSTRLLTYTANTLFFNIGQAVKVFKTQKPSFNFSQFEQCDPEQNQIVIIGFFISINTRSLQRGSIYSPTLQFLLIKNILLCQFPKMAYAIYF